MWSTMLCWRENSSSISLSASMSLANSSMFSNRKLSFVSAMGILLELVVALPALFDHFLRHKVHLRPLRAREGLLAAELSDRGPVLRVDSYSTPLHR